MTGVFTRLKPYGYVHHRALNDFGKMAEAERCIAAYPDQHQVLEGDICWNFENGRRDFYFRHPSYVVDTLSPAQFEAARGDGALVTLDDLIARDAANKHYVIELKVGRGDTHAALTALIQTLQAHCRDRFWIDGFSLRLLQMVKAIDSSVATSVHTELVTATHILLDAPEWPPLRFIPLDALRGVDAVSIRKRFSDAHMARASAAVLKRGLVLCMSRLFSLDDYALSRQWGASVGYPKIPFETLMAYERTPPKTG